MSNPKTVILIKEHIFKDDCKPINHEGIIRFICASMDIAREVCETNGWEEIKDEKIYCPIYKSVHYSLGEKYTHRYHLVEWEVLDSNE